MEESISNFKVTSRKNFVEFIELLRQDLLINPGNWQNDKLDTFLEALGSYTDDIQGYYDNTNKIVNADEPAWQTFADIFKGAMIYE